MLWRAKQGGKSMNTYQPGKKEQSISMASNNNEVMSVEESLMQQLVDMKVEIFLNKSAQYLQVTENKPAANVF